MKSKIPEPKLLTLSAIILGYLMIGDYTANEQNAIGNWFMTIGQILEANSAIQQAVEDKVSGNTININSRKCKETGNPYMDNPPLTDFLNNNELEIEKIKNIIKTLEEKLDNITKK